MLNPNKKLYLPQNIITHESVHNLNCNNSIAEKELSLFPVGTPFSILEKPVTRKTLFASDQQFSHSQCHYSFTVCKSDFLKFCIVFRSAFIIHNPRIIYVFDGSVSVEALSINLTISNISAINLTQTTRISRWV